MTERATSDGVRTPSRAATPPARLRGPCMHQRVENVGPSRHQREGSLDRSLSPAVLETVSVGCRHDDRVAAACPYRRRLGEHRRGRRRGNRRRMKEIAPLHLRLLEVNFLQACLQRIRNNVAYEHEEEMMVVNRSAPSTAVVPVLVYPDVSAAIPWLCDAFGFAERLRAPGRDGTISHAQLMSGAGDIMIGAAGGPFTSPEGDR